jgi:hypothetical protein
VQYLGVSVFLLIEKKEKEKRQEIMMAVDDIEPNVKS